MRRLRALLSEDLVLFKEKTSFFYEKTSFTSMRKPLALLREYLMLFYEKASCSPRRGPSRRFVGQTRGDQLIFYLKALWSSLSRPPALIGIDNHMLFTENISRSSKGRHSFCAHFLSSLNRSPSFIGTFLFILTIEPAGFLTKSGFIFFGHIGVLNYQ